MNLKGDTFKKDYGQAKTSKTLNRKLTRTKVKLLNFYERYSNNFRQDKRDFCPFLKSICPELFKRVYLSLFYEQKINIFIIRKLLNIKPVKEGQYNSIP